MRPRRSVEMKHRDTEDIEEEFRHGTRGFGCASNPLGLRYRLPSEPL
jgi:hypothetical protein